MGHGSKVSRLNLFEKCCQNIVDGIRNAAQDKFNGQDEVLRALKGQ